jgi:hypothetical protein
LESPRYKHNLLGVRQKYIYSSEDLLIADLKLDINRCNGDATTAERLLKQQQQKHQGQSDKWYLEKVIYDLERDRRY